MRKSTILAIATLISIGTPALAAGGPFHAHGPYPGSDGASFRPAPPPEQPLGYAEGKIAPSDVRIPPEVDRGYDVLHYDLEIEIDPQAESISGRVGIDLAAVEDGLATVVLDLVDKMAVDSLLWSGTPVPFIQGGDALIVDSPLPMEIGAEASLRIHYHGEPKPHGDMNVGLLFRAHEGPTDSPDDDAPVIFSIGEPWSSHSWWPCKDHPSDKATADVTVTVPEPLVAVSNGLLLGIDSPRPGMRTYRWRESYPIATYLIAVSVSDYVEWEETCAAAAGDLPLTFHVIPQDEQRVRADAASTCAMMNFLEGICGPYPFPAERYGLVEVVWAGAMEHQTATSFARFLATGDGRWETIFLHEMAHQWFGDRMTPKRWRDIWLNEGFARYCEALWIEHREGREAYLAAMNEMGPLRHPDLFAGDGVLVDPDPILPNELIYDKGAWVLHMLRGAVGDSAFFRFLRGYASDPATAGGNVETADMLAAATAATGIDVARLLGPWLETDLVPELNWSAAGVPLSGGGERLTLAAAQTQGRIFTLPLRLRVHTAVGPVDLRADLDSAAGEFSWDLPAAADSVSLDPEGWLLMRAVRAEAPQVSLLPPHPNPAGEAGTTLAYLVRSDGEIAVAAYDARGRNRGRWRLGFHAAAAEPYRWIWQGEDGGGRQLPSGVYWLVISGNTARDARRVTLVR